MDDTDLHDEEKEKLKLELGEALKTHLAVKPQPSDGWKVMKDPGEEFGGTWPVGILYASFKEFADAFGVKPWVQGAKASGADKGKVMLQFGVRDVADREWIFSAQYRLDRLDENENTNMVWQIKSNVDVIEVGQFLANRFNRPCTVQAYLADGTLHRASSTFYNKLPE